MSPDQVKTFWAISPETGKLSPEILDIYNFLNGRGFRKRTVLDEIELYRQNGYVIEQSYTANQINEISAYLGKEYRDVAKLTIDFPRKGPMTFEYTPKDILEKLVKYGWGKIFSDNNSNHLPELNVEIKKHTRDKAFFYFKNGFVEVTAQGARLKPYDDFNGKYIYKDYQINRDIKIVDIDDSVERDFASKGTDFFDFLSKVAGIVIPEGSNIVPNGDQVAKFEYLRRLIGFLLHEYKQQGLTDFAVILCDDNTGGSGKGIIIQALKEMFSDSPLTQNKVVCVIDCRKDVGKYDPDDLTERTRVKTFNDIPAAFNFGEVYNEITDGGTIRHMYGSPRSVPYRDAWKILLTSNYIVRGNSGPDNRRQKVFSMNPFFNDKNRVQDFYKQSFFSTDWKDEDWNFFYSTMFRCVQEWLSCSYKVDYVDHEYNERKMEASYPMEFREYVDKIERNTYHKTATLYWNIKEDNKYKLSPFVKRLTPMFFSTLLKQYLDELKIPHHKNCNRTEIWIGPEKK